MYRMNGWTTSALVTFKRRLHTSLTKLGEFITMVMVLYNKLCEFIDYHNSQHAIWKRPSSVTDNRDDALEHLSWCLQCTGSLESLSARIVNIGSYAPIPKRRLWQRPVMMSSHCQLPRGTTYLTQNRTSESNCDTISTRWSSVQNHKWEPKNSSILLFA